MISLPNDNFPLFEVPIYIIDKNGTPSIELRKNTTNNDLIKKIVECCFREQPIIIMPVFNNKILTVSQLVSKGIIYKDEKDNLYYFTDKKN
jgi:hypothetical protein